jgi:hypothetical protein
VTLRNTPHPFQTFRLTSILTITLSRAKLDSPTFGEVEFCELRLDGVLGSW